MPAPRGPEVASGSPSRIAALGYSESALHAGWLGAQGLAAAVVLLAGPVHVGEEVYLRWADRLGKEQIPWWLPIVLRPLGRTPREQVARVCTKLKATKTDVARLYGFKVPARFVREYLTHDPQPDLAAVRVPLLAITGTNDLSLDHRDLDILKRLIPLAETRAMSDLTHTLRRDPSNTNGRWTPS